MASTTQNFTVTSEVAFYNDATLVPGQRYSADLDEDKGTGGDILKKLVVKNTETGETFEVTEAAFKAISDSGLISFDKS
jgi:hypothetical protein